MNEVVQFQTDDLMPASRRVLGAQGVPPGVPVAERLSGLVDQAVRTLRELAAPLGVVREIDAAAFADILRGEGANAPATVVGTVLPRATALALFAATVGKEVGHRIEELFAADDFVAGSLLDAAASLAAEATAERLEGAFEASLRRRGAAGEDDHVLAYSPGYCGWHVSGQKRLFDVLSPERIGISLNERHLMTPLKSVSGVLVAAPTAAHDVPTDFDFCRACRDRTCVARIRRLRELEGTPRREPGP
ncbi:MAG: vitamin B12 dependent-methionine synthase activation domain-containing protein [Gemmatimonadota bacterium]|jgi:hypothetical protein